MQRHFLILQGPHGPFCLALARALRQAGQRATRIGFNAGDGLGWRGRDGYRPFRDKLDAWPGALGDAIREEGITDIVLYGDDRPVHRSAQDVARSVGGTLHFLEEGYLRPHWVTYERDGVNGTSPLMKMTLPDIRARLDPVERPQSRAPDQWGAARRHAYASARYHMAVLLGQGRYPSYRSHRDMPVAQEAGLHLRRLAAMPVRALTGRVQTRALRRSSSPYHLVLLQLCHDSAFRRHGPFPSLEAFAAEVMGAFARSAPQHHQLVFKAHPFEDGREPIRPLLQLHAREAGLERRVRFVAAGKLGALLDHARTAITVNSTSAQPALWRGVPTKVLGRAVYDKPGLVSAQSLEAFLENPDPVDRAAYLDYRRFLLETSQIKGSFYTHGGRRMILRRIVDMMLAAEGPYAKPSVSVDNVVDLNARRGVHGT